MLEKGVTYNRMNNYRIYALEESSGFIICIDRDWFKKGDTLYFYGLLIQIVKHLASNNLANYYQIDQPLKVHPGNHFITINMNRKLEILQELISIGVIVSEPYLIGKDYITDIDLSHCTDEARMHVLLDELMKIDD